MNSNSSIPIGIKLAANSFSPKRADYYEYIANVMIKSNGAKKPRHILENDVERYGSSPRGKLSKFWLERFLSNGADLAEAWSGTFPDDEMALIRIGQKGGSNALPSALLDIARAARLASKVKSETLSTLAMAFIAVAMGIGMLVAFVPFGSDMLRNTYGFLGEENFGPKATSFLRTGDWIKANMYYVAVAAALVIYSFKWVVENVTGDIREWLDRRIGMFRTMRDIKGVMFLSTMAMLTQKRSGAMFTLREALEMYLTSTRNRWMRWRIEQVLERISSTGALGSATFKTGLISDEMYYFLQDMQEANGFAEGFKATSEYVESHVLKDLFKRLTIYRVILMASGLSTIGYVFAWYTLVNSELKDVMKLILAI